MQDVSERVRTQLLAVVPMSAPDEIRQLADRLERHAEARSDAARPLLERRDLRAAAVALRHHANLIDAIGPPMRVMDLMARGTTMDAEGDELAELLSRIYAAAVSPPPAPTTCPTCGSDDPTHNSVTWSKTNRRDCPDEWHQAAT